MIPNVSTKYITTARRVISLPYFLFKLTFLSLCSLFVLHKIAKENMQYKKIPKNSKNNMLSCPRGHGSIQVQMLRSVHKNHI